MTQEMAVKGPRHQSPNLGAVAIVSTVLFCLGLFVITMMSGGADFPRPWDTAQTMAAYFQQHAKAVGWYAFLEFGSAVPLGIFTAVIVSRLHFLGVRAAGATIALYGGLAAAFALTCCSIVLWAMARPGVAENLPLTEALYYVSFGFGGFGYSVPLALLMSGVSVPLLFYRVVPKWIPVMGLIAAGFGVLSWLNLEFGLATFFIPLTRFPGFVWMIAVGFALPKVARTSARQVAS